MDADQKSLRVLEVSLKKAGYSVTKAVNGKDALEKMEFAEPDLVISDTAMPEMDGFELCTLLKQNEKWAPIPFIFLTAQKSIEDKIRGLELGVDDYLNKPIFIREILARVNLAIQRRQRERLERRGSKTSFSGELIDMGVLDLLQTIDISRKTGVIHILHDEDLGQIFFRDGKVINASTRNRKAADAVYRMLVWSHGHFEIEFKGVEGEETIELSTQGLLMEGMRRLDEWGRLQEQLPSLASTFDVDIAVIAERLGEIPDEINGILKHFDGKHTLMEVVDLGDLGDLEALTVITKLYFEGLITEVASETLGHHTESSEFIPQSSDQAETPFHSSEPSDVVGGPPSLVPAPDDVTDEGPTSPGTKMFETLRMSRADEDPPPGSPAPRLSVAVRGLGFIESLTRDDGSVSPASPTQPPPALTTPPRSWDHPLSSFEGRSIDPSRLSDPGPLPFPNHPISSTLEFVRDATGKIVPRHQEPPAPQTSVESQGAKDRAPAAPPPVPAAPPPVPAAPPPVPAAPPQAKGDDDSDRETKSLIPTDHHAPSATQPGPPPPQPKVQDPVAASDHWSNGAQNPTADSDPAGRIVAALDAEAPPPKDTEPPDQAREDTEYFNGESFAKVARGRSTAPQSVRLGVRESDSEVLSRPPVPLESWDPTPPARSSKGLIVTAIAAIALAAAAVVGWQFYGAQTSATVDDGPVDSNVAQKPDEPLPQPSALEPRPTEIKQIATAPQDSAPDTTEREDQPSAPLARAKDKPLIGTAPATEPAPISAPTGTDASYAELIAKSETLGRKQQVPLLREAMVLNPQNDEAPARLAIALMEGAKTRAEALMLGQQAVGLNPQNAMAWLAIGYIHQLEGRVHDSQAAYKRCAESEGHKRYVNECKKLVR
ncbi:MAG: DUF4388 domain-containing protein [Myxococcota bacterium]|nr:DUF4388 domain-containing protein [Myxococcota bacterium]